jgi:hypothetical protein
MWYLVDADDEVERHIIPFALVLQFLHGARHNVKSPLRRHVRDGR